MTADSAADVTEVIEQTATQRLLALRLLSNRKQRLDLQLKAQRHKWREKLEELTKSLHGLIDDIPVPEDQAGDLLEYIRHAYDERKRADSLKKRELDTTKAAIAQLEAAIHETIHADPAVPQMNLDLTEEQEGAQPWLVGDTGAQVKLAIEDHGSTGAEITADMDDLRGRLEELGVADLQLAPDPDATDADGDDGDDGDENEEESDDGEPDDNPEA